RPRDVADAVRSRFDLMALVHQDLIDGRGHRRRRGGGESSAQSSRRGDPPGDQRPLPATDSQVRRNDNADASSHKTGLIAIVTLSLGTIRGKRQAVNRVPTPDASPRGTAMTTASVYHA